MYVMTKAIKKAVKVVLPYYEYNLLPFYKWINAFVASGRELRLTFTIVIITEFYCMYCMHL